MKAKFELLFGLFFGMFTTGFLYVGIHGIVYNDWPGYTINPSAPMAMLLSTVPGFFTVALMKGFFDGNKAGVRKEA